MPVREEDDHVKAGAKEVSDLRSDDERGADMHQPGRLEPDVRPWSAGSIEERPQLVAGDDFLGAAQDGLESGLRGRKTRTCATGRKVSIPPKGGQRQSDNGLKPGSRL